MKSTSGLELPTAEEAFRMIETWTDEKCCGICLSDGGHGEIWSEERKGNVDCPVGVLRQRMSQPEEKVAGTLGEHIAAAHEGTIRGCVEFLRTEANGLSADGNPEGALWLDRAARVLESQGNRG